MKRHRCKNNYAQALLNLQRFKEVKEFLREKVRVARRVLGEDHELTLMMRGSYAEALCRDPAATLDDLREGVTMLEETARTARRVLGGTHPTTGGIEETLREARAALAARDVESLGDALGALGAA